MAWCVSSSHPCGSTMASEPCLFTNVFSGVSDIVAVSFSTSFNSNTNAVSCIFCSFPILWIPFLLLSFSMSVSQRGCWFLVEKITLLNSLSLLLNLFKWGEQLGGKFPICINALAVNTSVKPLPKQARGGQTLTLGWPAQSGGQASFGGQFMVLHCDLLSPHHDAGATPCSCATLWIGFMHRPVTLVWRDHDTVHNYVANTHGHSPHYHMVGLLCMLEIYLRRYVGKRHIVG